MAGTKHLLAVVRWPLGGIRTYMRYVYGRLGHDWKVTVVTITTHEDEALKEDARENGYELVLSKESTTGSLFVSIVKLVLKGHFDLIQSHGFTSAILVMPIKLLARIPHILTVHGVLEDRLLRKAKGRLRLLATKLAVKSSDVVYFVGNDIKAHVVESMPYIGDGRLRFVSIKNGISSEIFRNISRNNNLRRALGIDDDVFIFGFLGRYMPQKGFDTIIQSLVLMKDNPPSRSYCLIAIGSGDHLDYYKEVATEGGVADQIMFLPFQRDAATIYGSLDAVLMPSRWEAYPMVAAETLCCGIPLVASNCIGLREAIDSTPALVIGVDDHHALASTMIYSMTHECAQAFAQFRGEALDRFDVQYTVNCARQLFEETIKH